MGASKSELWEFPDKFFCLWIEVDDGGVMVAGPPPHLPELGRAGGSGARSAPLGQFPDNVLVDKWVFRTWIWLTDWGMCGSERYRKLFFRF